MDLIYGDSIVLGTCKSISESGLRGTLEAPVPTGTRVLLTLYHGNDKVQVPSVVDTGDLNEVSLQFQIDSNVERTALRDFLQLLGR